MQRHLARLAVDEDDPLGQRLQHGLQLDAARVGQRRGVLRALLADLQLGEELRVLEGRRGRIGEHAKHLALARGERAGQREVGLQHAERRGLARQLGGQQRAHRTGPAAGSAAAGSWLASGRASTPSWSIDPGGRAASTGQAGGLGLVAARGPAACKT